MLTPPPGLAITDCKSNEPWNGSWSRSSSAATDFRKFGITIRQTRRRRQRRRKRRHIETHDEVIGPHRRTDVDDTKYLIVYEMSKRNETTDNATKDDGAVQTDGSEKGRQRKRNFFPLRRRKRRRSTFTNATSGFKHYEMRSRQRTTGSRHAQISKAQRTNFGRKERI